MWIGLFVLVKVLSENTNYRYCMWQEFVNVRKWDIKRPGGDITTLKGWAIVAQYASGQNYWNQPREATFIAGKQLNLWPKGLLKPCSLHFTVIELGKPVGRPLKFGPLDQIASFLLYSLKEACWKSIKNLASHISGRHKNFLALFYTCEQSCQAGSAPTVVTLWLADHTCTLTVVTADKVCPRRQATAVYRIHLPAAAMWT